ncbi:MAG: hypothetical protein OIN66_11880 [Candidatus Methanoperedens sp.]|nr:hypothetical protein [Candidatus Methanoperedens sp.]
MRNTYKIHPISAYMSAFIYAVNPMTIDFFWGGTNAYVSGIFYSIIPLILYAENAYLNEKNPLHLAILIISSSLEIALLPQVFIIIFLFIFIYSIITIKKLSEPKNFRALLGILLLGALLSINTLGFVDSRLTAINDPSYDKKVTNDIKFAYSNMSALDIISISGNYGNYFVYNSININSQYSYKWVYFGLFVFTFSSFLLRKPNYPHFVCFLLCILITLNIVLILMYIHSISIQNLNDLSSWSILRNPDKLYFVYFYFFSMAFAFSIEKFRNYKDVPSLNILLVLLFFSIMIYVFFPILGTFGGLDKFHSSNSIEKLSVAEPYRSLPNIINDLNLTGRVAIFPYELYELNEFKAGGTGGDIQNMLIPVLPQVVGIRKGGILEYDNHIIINIKKFYQSISNHDISTMENYSRILSIEAYMIRKDVKNNLSKIYVMDHWQGAPYITGNPKNFIDFFKMNNYSIIFENDNFVIFKSRYPPFGGVYGVKLNNNSLLEVNPAYIISNYEKVIYTKINPTYYKVSDNNTDLLILSQSYSSNWIACIDSKCIKSENILGLNGFKINNTGSVVEIKHAYGALYFWGSIISYSAYSFLVIYILYWSFNHVRQKK